MRYVAILPLACYTLMIAYAAYGAMVVGHWPYYANPDPKELPFRALGHAVTILMLIGALAVVLTPLAYATWRLVLRLKHRVVPNDLSAVVFYALGTVIWIADVAAMRGRMPWPSVLTWLLD